MGWVGRVGWVEGMRWVVEIGWVAERRPSSSFSPPCGMVITSGY